MAVVDPVPSGNRESHIITIPYPGKIEAGLLVIVKIVHNKGFVTRGVAFFASTGSMQGGSSVSSELVNIKNVSVENGVMTIACDAPSGWNSCKVAVLQLDLDSTSSGGVTKKKIKFTIDSKSYEADEGMTWEQWVNSTYNTDGFVITGQKIMRNNYVVRKNSGGDALSSDYIVSGAIYWLVSQHNGGAG